MNRRGLTLLEVIVVLAVIGVLVALIAPAIQSSRETARRLQCASQLKQLALACSNYESQHGMFPPGACKGFGWLVAILPFMDQAALYHQVDFSKTPTTQQRSILTFVVPGTLCPSETQAVPVGPDAWASTSYAANSGTGLQAAGFNGMFRHLQVDALPPYREGPIRAADVVDGLSNTALLSEILVANLTGDWLRAEWYLTTERSGRNELDAFAEACVAETPRRQANGAWYADDQTRGGPWLHGDSGTTWYNHILTPQLPSCMNGSAVQYGAYTAASLHAGGVNVVFADGHGDFVSRSVDRRTWRQLGSRVESDLVP